VVCATARDTAPIVDYVTLSLGGRRGHHPIKHDPELLKVRIRKISVIAAVPVKIDISLRGASYLFQQRPDCTGGKIRLLNILRRSTDCLCRV